ncbi:hypothetical protein EI94DRAFT_1696889, partial [Lactarius quietus]
TYIWESSENVLSEIWEPKTGPSFARELLHGMEWFDIYQLGFGHFQLVTPGFTTQHFIPMASFLQEVAPLWTFALGQEVYDGGLLEGAVNQEHEWLDEESETQRNLQHARCGRKYQMWMRLKTLGLRGLLPDSKAKSIALESNSTRLEEESPGMTLDDRLRAAAHWWGTGPQVLNQKPKSNDMALLNVLVPEHMDIT